jgi:hypothetical protein
VDLVVEPCSVYLYRGIVVEDVFTGEVDRAVVAVGAYNVEEDAGEGAVTGCTGGTGEVIDDSDGTLDAWRL